MENIVVRNEPFFRDFLPPLRGRMCVGLPGLGGIIEVVKEREEITCSLELGRLLDIHGSTDWRRGSQL